jgi:hypothetical protein
MRLLQGIRPKTIPTLIKSKIFRVWYLSSSVICSGVSLVLILLTLVNRERLSKRFIYFWVK